MIKEGVLQREAKEMAEASTLAYIKSHKMTCINAVADKETWELQKAQLHSKYLGNSGAINQKLYNL